MSSSTLILVVDDDPVVREFMSATLEDADYAVATAADGAEAFAFCCKTPPDLIVADVIMPGMDGFQLCEELRQRPETAYIPILVATGLDDEPSIVRAFDAGATDFINKPIKWVILGYRVRYMLRTSRVAEELRDNEARLLSAKEMAESASRAKSEFLTNMSHELRTPLNAVIGFSDIMQAQACGPLSERYVEYSKTINESGTHLLAIINNVLDLAKADANKLTLTREPVDMRGIVSFCAGITREMAEKSNVSLAVEMDDDLPPLVADATKLRQILLNLLSNAVKFTQSGGSVTLAVGTDPSGDLIVRVIDTGIGIPADKIDLAFAPFGQVDSRLARKYEGTGLGLPLTRRLVELHRGSISLRSEVGRGTDVTVVLPRARAHPADELANEAESQAA
jgi:signal transduction histidine kinase